MSPGELVRNENSLAALDFTGLETLERSRATFVIIKALQVILMHAQVCQTTGLRYCSNQPYILDFKQKHVGRYCQMRLSGAFREGEGT